MTITPPPGCGCYPGHTCRLCQLTGAAALRPPRSLPCVHEGGVLERCHTCPATAEGRHVRECDVHGTCTRETVGPKVRGCDRCPDYQAEGAQPLPPALLTRKWRWEDPFGVLPPAPAAAHFNASLLKYGTRRIAAFRTGWAGADVHLAELDELYRPTRTVRLELLRNAQSDFGREDPRLFLFRDRLHVSYTAYDGHIASVAYARLTDDLEVDRVFAPVYAKRRHWEKNWVFFDGEQAGEAGLFAVYESWPDHHIVRVVDDQVVDAYTTPNPFPWTGGHLRGGASPHLSGGHFYHFFHGAWELGESWPTRRYNVGVTVFEAKPPFRIVAQTPDPILVADPATRPPDQYCDVVFPGGAVLEDGPAGKRWVVAMGVHDRWTEFAELDAAAVDVACGLTAARH